MSRTLVVALLAAMTATVAADRASVRERSNSAMWTGAAALRNKQYAQATTQLQDAIAVDDSNHVAWYWLGRVARETRRPGDAIDAIRKALELAPDAVSYREQEGLALYEDGRIDDAITSLEQAVGKDPTLVQGSYVLGGAHRDRGDAAKAAGAFTVACRSAHGPACVALTELYWRWGHHEQAAQVAAQAIGAVVDPAVQLELQLLRGRAYAGLQQDDRAIEAFSKALEIDGASVLARYHRGMAHARTGDRVQARKDLEGLVAPGRGGVEMELAAAMVVTLRGAE